MYSEGNEEEREQTPETFSLEVSRERAESLWRQVMGQKSSGRPDLAAARASRAKAEMERQRVSQEALDATSEACKQIIEETEKQLTKAKEAQDQAEQKLAEAETHVKQAQMAQSEAYDYREKILAEAESQRVNVMAEADSYRTKVMADTEKDVQRLHDEARAAALQECEDLKRHVTYEVQAILAEVDAIRAAAQEELEAQRIYAETANIKATSLEVRAQVMGRVDKAVNENTASAGVLSIGDTGWWENTEVEKNQSPEAMDEAQEKVAAGEPQADIPLEQTGESPAPRASKAKSSK